MGLFGRKAPIILYQIPVLVCTIETILCCLYTLVARIIHNRNPRRRNTPITVKISFSTILVLGLGLGPCVGAVLVMAWLVPGVFTVVVYTLPAPQKKCRPYRTITEWDTMLTDETQSRYNLNPATSRTFWFQNRDPLYLTAVKQNIAWGCSAWQ